MNLIKENEVKVLKIQYNYISQILVGAYLNYEGKIRESAKRNAALMLYALITMGVRPKIVLLATYEFMFSMDINVENNSYVSKRELSDNQTKDLFNLVEELFNKSWNAKNKQDYVNKVTSLAQKIGFKGNVNSVVKIVLYMFVYLVDETLRNRLANDILDVSGLIELVGIRQKENYEYIAKEFLNE
ncbi:MAG: hypothetical protein FWF51_05710 [Chitinivibrionia bacterium]|nr:hypothetical protein [Chitinivibrionia bacterium]